MTIDELLARLEGVRASGSGHVARCPAHEDRRASLSIGEGDDGTTLIKCFAGCDPSAILAALGLRMRDLFASEPARQRTRGRIAAEYDYRDEAGTLLYQAVRMIPKDFRQRVPDGSGGWSWRLNGVRRVLYRLPELLAADASQTVYIVEGEKDCDRLRSLGLVATTNAGGAGKWRDEYSEHLRGRRVAIIPDHDDPGRKHAEQVARSLAGIAERVNVLSLPDLPPKGDVSDWLGGGGTVEELRALAEAAPEWAPAAESAAPADRANLVPIEAVDDPHRLARICLAERWTREEGATLRYWQGSYWEWTGACYREVPTEEIKARVNALAKAELDRANIEAQIEADDEDGPPPAKKVSTRLVADTVAALGARTLIESSVTMPAWLGAEAPFPAEEILAAPNSLVHIPSLVAGKPYQIPPTPQYFSANSLDYDFLLDAPGTPHWLEFLGQIWPNEPACIELLQEWFGYSLLHDTSQQKILLLVGPKRGGKGTIARQLTRTVGAANVCGPTLSGLGTNFGLWPLIGKSLAIISDARLSGRTDTATVVERLLSISGEDAVTIDRKNMSHVTTRLRTRFLLLTNELPRLSDSSGALASRMLILPMTNSWYGREDTRLTDKLASETPGILLWAIEGWRRLTERGHFVQPEAGREMADELEDLTSPIGAFIRQRCEVGAFEEPCSELFAAWLDWRKDMGREYYHGDSAAFGRNLRAALPKLRKVQHRIGIGAEQRRTWYYQGIRLALDGTRDNPLHAWRARGDLS